MGAVVALAAFSSERSARADASPDAEAVEARERLRATLSSMEGTAAHLRAVLRDARKTRDAAKIGCADEALSRVDVSLRQAKEHTQAALDAFVKRDVGEARREVRVVAALRDAVRDAGVFGDACAVGPSYDLPSQRDATVVRVYVVPRPPSP